MPKREKVLTLLFICWSVQISVFAQQAPVTVLLDNVRELGNSVAMYAGDTKMSASFADETFKRAKQAMEAVDLALAGGVPAARTVSVRLADGEKPMTLAEIKAMCEQIVKLAATTAAAQAIVNTSVWPKYIADGTIQEEIQARGALESSNSCIKTLDKALSNGVLESTIVEVNDRKMSLAEGRETCVYVSDVAQKIVNKNIAAVEAQYEPFRKLLSGDRLRLYNSRLKTYKGYGAGGRVLRTPEDYRDSLIWCTSGVDRNGIVPMWEVDCWQFKGMTQVGSVVTRTGQGESPPSSAFR